MLDKLPDLSDYYLAGGTAIALQIGHRKSIDFDFFAHREVDINHVMRILSNFKISNTLVSTIDQFTCIADDVKVTFLNYPFDLNLSVNLGEKLRMPDLIDLAASKAYTLGRRPKWKDYVDLYFLINKFGIKPVISRAEEIYKGLFNDKLFREQLVYFKDVDFSEDVEYIGESVGQDTIKNFLEDVTLSF